MIKAGIDIGSRTIKLVLREGEETLHSVVRENTFNTLEVCREMLNGYEYNSITATGYGRHLFAEKFSAKVISEISAFAMGIHQVYPGVRTILDIGGQDTKAISIDAAGNLLKFEMNDKCAAGTGRFLEIMAMALRFSLDEFGEKALAAAESENVNSMCTVFAESEVISLLATGADRQKVARGIHQSVIKRAISLIKRVGIKDEVAFVGGVAHNIGMRRFLEEALNKKVLVPSNPQIIGALGCTFAGPK